MDFYSIAGIDVTLESQCPAGGTRYGEAQFVRVRNCEWQAEFAINQRAHGACGWSLEVTPLNCTGNRHKFERDLPWIQPLFERVLPEPEACLVVLHALAADPA